MGSLKFLLWFLLVVMLFFTDTKDKSESYKWQFTIEFSVIVVCLTVLYVFGK